MTQAVASRVSDAYEFAERLHGHFFNDPETRNRGPIDDGEVRTDITQPSGTERLTVRGTIEGQPVSQHLSRSRRTGQFYLSTVFTNPRGKVLRTSIGEESPEESKVVLEESLFMDAFRRTSQTSLF
jgi:hypothetical protein